MVPQAQVLISSFPITVTREIKIQISTASQADQEDALTADLLQFPVQTC